LVAGSIPAAPASKTEAFEPLFFNDKTFHQNPSFSIAYSEKEGGVGMSGFFGGGNSGGFGTLFLLLIIIIIFFSAGVDF
jgi:hypothetical protein